MSEAAGMRSDNQQRKNTKLNSQSTMDFQEGAREPPWTGNKLEDYDSRTREFVPDHIFAGLTSPKKALGIGWKERGSGTHCRNLSR